MTSMLPVRKPVRTVAPTFDPVTLAQAKKQVELAADVSHHDEHLSQLLDMAADMVEHDTGLVLCSSTWTYKLDAWPLFIELPLRPVTSVSSITYIDTSGNSQTWSSSYYTLDTSRTYPIVLKDQDADYPDLEAGTWNPITITVVAGYANAAAVPLLAKQAILLKVAEMFNDREGMAKTGEGYERLIRRLMRSTYP